jgi:hypothetical protein
MLIKVLILFIALFFTPAYAIGEDLTHLMIENRLLKDELSLAQKTNIYIVFHLKEKTIQIKAKGMTLREFSIQDVHSWGSNLPGNSLILVKKTAVTKPARGIVMPGDNKKSDDFQLDVLELEDMPARYTLILGKRVFVSVKPSKGFFSKIGNVLSSLKNLIMRPAITFWYAVRGKQYTALDIFLEKQDAKALYWSFTEGTRGVVYPP